MYDNRWIAQNVSSFNHDEVPLQSSFDYTTNSNLNKEEIEENEKLAPKTFFIETYGCQMNESDTEIVNSILKEAGYIAVKDVSEAHIILLNTCAIRENAEGKVWHRLNELRVMKSKVKSSTKLVIGVLGIHIIWKINE